MQELHAKSDKGIHTDAVILFFFYRKEVDKVSHAWLIYKLKEYSKRDEILPAPKISRITIESFPSLDSQYTTPSKLSVNWSRRL